MKKIINILAAAMSVVALAACSDKENDYLEPRVFADQNAPQVLSVSPEAGATQLDSFTNVVITYDEPVYTAPNTTIRVYTDDSTYYYLNDTLSYTHGNQLIIPIYAQGGQAYKVVVMKPTVRDSSYNFASEYSLSFSVRAYNNFADSLFQITPTLVNPNATEPTKKLYQYLVDNFGKNVLTGAMANVNWNTAYADTMYQMTGRYPALNCFDFIHHPWSKPLRNSGWIDYTNTKPVEDWYNNGGIVACMWHWNVPASAADSTNLNTYTFSADKTAFTSINATRTNRWEYAWAKRDIDIIADYLLSLQAKGIPVIWRPLHEARGNYGKWDGTGKAWFWWGASGPAYFKKLWRMMFDEFKARGVNNVIWVWTSEGYYDNGDGTTDDALWYPGDEYVDIIARDYYSKNQNTTYHASIAKEYETLRKITNGRKLITLAECDAIPSIDNMFTDGAMWSWVMPWCGADSEGTKYVGGSYNTSVFLNSFFNNDNVITRDELPSLK